MLASSNNQVLNQVNSVISKWEQISP